MASSALPLLLEGLRLAVMLTAPGALILILMRRPPRDLGRLLVYGAAVSVLFVVIASAALLHLGVFSIRNLWLILMLPALLAGVRWRKVRACARGAQVDWPALIVLLSVGAFCFLVLTTTPLWNFLVAPNMDAGNYELYGNHFWTTGSFYLDESHLIERGALPEWVESHNTWNVNPDTGIARPSYLPGYSVLLGVVKANFGTVLASPAANAFLISLAAMVMVLVGLRILRSPSVIGLLTAAIVMTPIVFFYGKQLMSEAFGVLGVVLAVCGIVEMSVHMEQRADADSQPVAALVLASGLSIGLLARLDFYLLLPLILVGMGLVVLEATVKGGERLSLSFFMIPAVSVSVSTSVVAFLGEPSYLRHGQPSFLEGVISASEFILMFGIANSLALISIWILHIWALRLETPKRRRAWLRLLSSLYASASVGWVVYVVWSLYVRPLDGTGPAAHDPENLIRLFSVTSPVILGLILLLVPIALLTRRSERGLFLGFVVGFSVVLYASRHSPLEVWWMRRYVQYFVPIALLAFAGVTAQLCKRAPSERRRTNAMAACLLLILTLAQTWSLRHMMTAEVNRDTPLHLSRITHSIPEEAFVIVLEGNSMVRGLANTYRSLDDNVVLVDVPLEDLVRAATLAPPDVPVVVVTTSNLDGSLVQALGLDENPVVGQVARQWVDRLEEFRVASDEGGSVDYLLYKDATR